MHLLHSTRRPGDKPGKSKQRLSQWYPNVIQVHLPVHASWLNQVEIYFSSYVGAVEQKLMAFQIYYEQSAKPFEWKFTRSDLDQLLAKLKPYYKRPAKEAA